LKSTKPKPGKNIRAKVLGEITVGMSISMGAKPGMSGTAEHAYKGLNWLVMK
jgi:hypothetical protein